MARAKIALVTGAGQRVGRALAEAMAADGFRVGVHYRASREGADECVAAIRARGGEAEAFAADLSDARACDQLVDDVYTHFDGLDLLVNSAAGMEKTRLGNTTAAQFDAIIALNLRAPFLLAQAAALVRSARAAAGGRGGAAHPALLVLTPCCASTSAVDLGTQGLGPSERICVFVE